MAEETRREEYASLTVAQLKELAKGRGLPFSGPKGSLIGRLLEADAAAEVQVEPEVTEATEPEVTESKAEAKPQERRCDTCKEPFVPARPEFKHCPSCHAEWQFKQDFPKVEGKLKGAKKAFGRFNNYNSAQVLFDEASAYFVDGNFEAALAALKDASDEVDVITARGSLKYARRLFSEAEENGISVAEETVALADQAEAALPKEGKAGKPWQAAKNAGKLRDLLRSLASEIREAKDRRERAKFVGAPVREIIPQETRQALEQMGRGRQRHQSGGKGRSQRKGQRDGPPGRDPYDRSEEKRQTEGVVQEALEERASQGTS